MTGAAAGRAESLDVAAARWPVVPLKYQLEYIEGPGIMAADFVADGVPLLRISSVAGRYVTLDGCDYLEPALVASKWSHFQVRARDLLISGSASTGLCAEVTEETAGAIPYTGLIIIRPRCDFDRDFARWFLLSDLFAKQVAVLQAGSAIQHFGPSHLGVMFCPVPSPTQQRAIARFLDEEVGAIDAAISAKRRVLDLLAEKRKAVIATAVTRGLDPKVKLRDSGVPWLGEIPAHWRSTRVGRLFRQSKILDYPDLTVLSVYREFGVIERASRDDNANRVPDDLNKYQLVEVGDLVINKMKAWQGSLGVSDFRGITSPDYVVFRPAHAEEPQFLHSMLRMPQLTTVYLSISNGIRINQWRIEPERFANVEVFLPTLDEQRDIVEHIARETAKLDAVRAATERTIALLKERRSALIAAAVTGQLDVGAGA